MPQRAFDFEGDDAQYIKHLESLLLSVQPPLNSRLGKLGPVANALEPPPSSIQFIEWKPDHTSLQVNPMWMKQLNAFIEGIPVQDQWREARVKAGIDTPDRNQHALKLILGHVGPAIFHDEYETTAQAPVLPTESRDLVDTTNDTMRRYTGRDQKDHTLAKYRNGAVWVNRCMVALLKNGWGHKSWEIFLLNSQSPAQIARFAAYNADSYKIVAHRLGEATVPQWEIGWVPYCLPCIVHYLTGYTVPLQGICEALGYGRLPPYLMQAISMHFIETLNSLFANDGILPVPIGPYHAESNVIHPLP
ncbi:uncharacterized protein N7473_004309 [Penicillium subrubescens]|uniref:uncharacterized protein n=1 Tax=Penicillium subrubescens TaxID=1316194 RepID=UPI00254538C2|nr:uncharacterized protein N7473_004309 [Penicillium subrubescens]KAJ5900239.1 hypothetical protein N7473_004309 [Penicillium subrubescens]